MITSNVHTTQSDKKFSQVVKLIHDSLFLTKTCICILMTSKYAKKNSCNKLIKKWINPNQFKKNVSETTMVGEQDFKFHSEGEKVRATD